SGKSNVLRAISDMRNFVLRSFRSNAPTGPTGRRPFRLDADSGSTPSKFEVDFILEGVRHEYGFSVDDTAVLTEWARRYPRGRVSTLFNREGMEVEFVAIQGAKSRAVRELLRPNALFLSAAAAAGHSRLLPMYEWIRRNF